MTSLAARSTAAESGPHRIALAHPIRSTKTMTKEGAPIFKAFLEALEKGGYFEGRNLTVERFSALGFAEKYHQTVVEVIDTKPELIVTASDRMTTDFARNTNSIPIAAIMTDPTFLKLTQSLAHPDRNVTGVIVSPGADIWRKRVEYLKEIVPDTKYVFVVAAQTFWETPEISSIRQAIEESGCIMVGPPVDSPHQDAQYRAAFAAASKRANVCLVSTSVENSKNQDVIVGLAREFKVPAIYPYRDYVDAGGLMAHDIDLVDLYTQLGRQSADILSGVSIQKIPFYQPYKLKLIINLRAAEEMRVTIPPDLLARADETLD
ncbi:ABC transporter substrate-binding protein [Methylobacterium sp. P31]